MILIIFFRVKNYFIHINVQIIKLRNEILIFYKGINRTHVFILNIFILNIFNPLSVFISKLHFLLFQQKIEFYDQVNLEL